MVGRGSDSESGLSLRDRVRSSDIRERLRSRAAAPLCREEPVKVVRASRKDGCLLDASSLRRCFRACPSGRRPQGRPRTHWTEDYISRLSWERLARIPPEELVGSGWGEDCLGLSAETASPATWTRIS
ncbi:hypothetical protein L3Q82_009098, partial [Scortum barcoo]